jgi:two-component system KDP operon response regulator KdpE
MSVVIFWVIYDTIGKETVPKGVEVALTSIKTAVGKKILVIDDDPAFVRGVGQALTRRGYEVLSASSGGDGLRLLFTQRPDMVLLDVVMPGMDGCQTCRRIRDISDVPIIMLTAGEKTEDDVVRGLDCGADDYVIKPVGSKELVARMRAVMRRAELPSFWEGDGVTYSDDFLGVDIARRKVVVNGKRVRLTPMEFRLLALLVQNAGRVLTHQQLLEKVWGWEYINDLDYIRIYVWHLRQKIEPDPSQPKYILTEPGVGYYFHKAD